MATFRSRSRLPSLPAGPSRYDLFLIVCAFAAWPAWADDKPPLLSASARNTTDLWVDAPGGTRTGTVVLNKLQVSGTFAGDDIGIGGLSIHGQIFRTDGSSLSERIGDIQTADSIDTRPATRLFEAWVEQKIGNADRSVAVRAGLIDLNADFDSVQTASLFVNSSHGIGADLSRSGLNGPSIYPVSSLGVRLSWLPSKSWTFRVAAFDGVSGDPARPRAFVSARLAGSDGALVIGQSDYRFSDKGKLELGVWRYTVPLPDVDTNLARRHVDQGAYISIESVLPGSKKWSAWVRGGVADGRAQIVASYLGGGVVREGLFAGRPNDRLGLAVARAGIGGPARRAVGLPSAETTFELTYQYKIKDTAAIQPDVQYVIHPAAYPREPSALVFGVRLVLTAGYPRKAPATDAADPTVPPEGPQPTDANGTPPG